MSSAAVPGASQHLSLLALDIAEYASPGVRQILAKHGWHQTVLEDYSHFTWLGVSEEELSGPNHRPIGPHTSATFDRGLDDSIREAEVFTAQMFEQVLG